MRALLLSVLIAGCAGAVHADSPKMADDTRDSRLPSPFGVGVNFYHQSQGYDLSSLRVNVLPGDLAALEGIEIDNDVTEMNVKLDYWLFPFLNVFGILGSVDGETDVDTDLIPGLSVEYEGVVYGAGVTLAAGWEQYFVTLTAALTETELDTSTSSVKAWILSPKVGMAGRYGAVWIGGMYQQTDEKHEGNITVPVFGRVDYNVEFEQKESWNGSVGFTTGIGENWQIDLEGGFGDRMHASVSTTYRF
ncbi:MAG: hypothetical protein ISS31_06340 [Kiritimatiellae bacterium]|nr:hypothetical protein [Kiritimatiellia bacterium]